MSTKCKMRNAAQWMIVMVCAWAVQPQAQATSISITNPSFETPSFAPGGGIGADNGSFFTLTGWKGTTTSPFYWVCEYANCCGLYTDPIPDGTQVGYVFGQPGTLWQATSKTFLPDESYSLTVSLGQRTDEPFASANVQLYVGTDTSVLANNTLLKQSSITVGPGSGKWFTQSLTFGPTDPGYAGFLSAHQGEPLIIGLFANGQIINNNLDSETDWDNVQFSYIPEPTSLALLGLGGMLLLRLRTR